MIKALACPPLSLQVHCMGSPVELRLAMDSVQGKVVSGTQRVRALTLPQLVLCSCSCMDSMATCGHTPWLRCVGQSVMLQRLLHF